MIVAEKLADFILASVICVNPIKIQVSQKLILDENFLVISERLTDRFIYMTAAEDNFTDITDRSKYEARKKYIVYDGLKVGDRVILARKAGGQKYFVIDRVGAV